MDFEDDAAANAAADRVVERFRSLLSGLPLRAAFVDALGVEAQPAVQAMLFALSTDRAADTTSLEHHETTAMVALLGRAFAFDGTTTTAAYGVVPALLAAFRAEGFEVPNALDSPLAVVFLEGYVRGREEKVRAESSARALDSVVLVRIADRVGLVVARGAHDPDLLGARLESVAREAFGLELGQCIVDVGPLDVDDPRIGPVVNLAETLASIGVAVVVASNVAAPFEARKIVVRDSVRDAVDYALALDSLCIRPERRLPGTLRELLGARRGPRR